MVVLHGAILLVFGVFLSVAFADVKLNKKNILITLAFCVILGALSVLLYIRFSEQFIWWIYPLIVHLPTVLFLVLVYKKNPLSSAIALFIAYLMCQPAKWVGVLVFQLCQTTTAEYLARILCLCGVGVLALKFATPCLRGILNKSIRSVLVFGIVPCVYYGFDYVTSVYTASWLDRHPVTLEFMPLLLCGTFLIFCMVYYREYEQRADAQRKEQIVRLVAQQQSVQMEKVKMVEQELRVARHDMRHLLTQLALCIDAKDDKKAKELLRSYMDYIDGTQLTRFCQCDTVNYILSAFSARCAREGISLHYDINLDEIQKDELLFGSILQNALENACNAQLELEPQQRQIWLLLKTMDDKLLLSIKNPTRSSPVFADGLPQARKPGHGYGTHSIRYLSERLGGSCQFSVKDGLLVLRVLL